MNEAETRAELIDPALTAAGWGVVDGSRVRREMISQGRLEGFQGRRAPGEIADYVLIHRNTKLAVIEAKRRGLSETEGLGQAKLYAGKLLTRFAFATNGTGIYRVDMQTGAEGPVAAGRLPTSFGQRPSRKRTSGATASPPYLTRIEAASGKAAIIRTMRSPACIYLLLLLRT